MVRHISQLAQLVSHFPLSHRLVFRLNLPDYHPSAPLQLCLRQIFLVMLTVFLPVSLAAETVRLCSIDLPPPGIIEFWQGLFDLALMWAMFGNSAVLSMCPLVGRSVMCNGGAFLLLLRLQPAIEMEMLRLLHFRQGVSIGSLGSPHQFVPQIIALLNYAGLFLLHHFFPYLRVVFGNGYVIVDDIEARCFFLDTYFCSFLAVDWRKRSRVL